MKKIVVAVIAVMMMALSAVPAFAAISSPVATTVPETQPETRVSVPDNGKTSPKTGETRANDTLVYVMIGLAIAGCGAASAGLVKAANKK